MIVATDYIQSMKPKFVSHRIPTIDTLDKNMGSEAPLPKSELCRISPIGARLRML